MLARSAEVVRSAEEEAPSAGTAACPAALHLLESHPDAVEWPARLRALLVRYPGAWVGEFGLDRAAVVRGTKVSFGGGAGGAGGGINPQQGHGGEGDQGGKKHLGRPDEEAVGSVNQVD